MDDLPRWVVGLIIALALGLVLIFARGLPGGGRGDPSSSTSVIESHA